MPPNPHEPGEAWDRPSLTASEGNQPCPHLDSELLDPKLQENTFPVCEPRFVSVVTAAPGN